MLKNVFRAILAGIIIGIATSVIGVYFFLEGAWDAVHSEEFKNYLIQCAKYDALLIVLLVAYSLITDIFEKIFGASRKKEAAGKK